MSNLPTNVPSTTIPLNPIDTIIGMFKHTGLVARLQPQPVGSGIVVTFTEKHLDSLGNSDSLKEADTLIRNLLYPFQELLKLVANGTITGFAFIPDPSISDQAAAHKRTELIGRTLQSLCNGEISLR